MSTSVSFCCYLSLVFYSCSLCLPCRLSIVFRNQVLCSPCYFPLFLIITRYIRFISPLFCGITCCVLPVMIIHLKTRYKMASVIISFCFAQCYISFEPNQHHNLIPNHNPVSACEGRRLISKNLTLIIAAIFKSYFEVHYLAILFLLSPTMFSLSSLSTFL